MYVEKFKKAELCDFSKKTGYYIKECFKVITLFEKKTWNGVNRNKKPNTDEISLFIGNGHELEVK